MDKNSLTRAILSNSSFLSVGLDSEVSRLPAQFPANARGMLEFNKHIIEVTSPFCVAYKLNTAFYEALGADGWKAMEETIRFIPADKFIIADGKRGDIGNTSHHYAKAFFEQMRCDAVTVAPYMGRDSVAPFLEYNGKWAVILGLTSNEGSADFQLQQSEGHYWYEQVLEKAAQWGTTNNTMFVIGATHPRHLENVRRIVPDHFLLVPGIGVQGGNLAEVCQYGMNADVGLLLNASRSIIFASAQSDFAEAAAIAARSLQLQMKRILDQRGFYPTP